MKKIMFVLLLTGCVSKSYTIPQTDAVYEQIGKALNQQNGYLQAVIHKIYAKKIAECRAKGMGLDIAKEICIADPKPEAPKK